VTTVAEETLAGRWPPMPRLAQGGGAASPARHAEPRAHARAIALPEQAADQHARWGRDERARAERDGADHTRKRLNQALVDDEEAGSCRPGRHGGGVACQP
jgi:hypothetical protein